MGLVAYSVQDLPLITGDERADAAVTRELATVIAGRMRGLP